MDRALGLTGGKQGTMELLNAKKTLLRNQLALPLLLPLCQSDNEISALEGLPDSF